MVATTSVMLRPATSGSNMTTSGSSSPIAASSCSALVARAGRTAMPELRNWLMICSASSTEFSMKRILMT